MEFSFLKNTNKKDKKFILLLQTLFSFFTLFFKKIKIKKAKVGQKLSKKDESLSSLIKKKCAFQMFT
jgi:hypothetical protein